MLKVENFSRTTKLLVCLFIDCLGTTNFNFEVMNAFGLFKQVHNSIQWSANCAKKAIYTWRKKGFGHNEKGTIVRSSLQWKSNLVTKTIKSWAGIDFLTTYEFDKVLYSSCIQNVFKCKGDYLANFPLLWNYMYVLQLLSFAKHRSSNLIA